MSATTKTTDRLNWWAASIRSALSTRRTAKGAVVQSVDTVRRGHK